MRKRAYRSVRVKDVDAASLESLAPGAVWAGLDVAKAEVLVVLRDSQGNFERPWSVQQPVEIPMLVERLKTIAASHELVVALEPTGTYGDALRQALGDAGLTTHRVSGKASKDFAELFDGVPSAHDGKDAAVVAELAAIGKSRPWRRAAVTKWDSEIKVQTQWLDAQRSVLQQWLGQIEGLLGRHWPELTRLLKLSSATLLRLLAHYGGPAGVAQDADAAKRIAAWGGRWLTEKKVSAVIATAGATAGVRMSAADVELLRRMAAAALAARRGGQAGANSPLGTLQTSCPCHTALRSLRAGSYFMPRPYSPSSSRQTP